MPWVDCARIAGGQQRHEGRGAANVAALGAVRVKVAQSVLAETQAAILPIVPYLNTLRWVLIAIALSGFAATILGQVR